MKKRESVSKLKKDLESLMGERSNTKNTHELIIMRLQSQELELIEKTLYPKAMESMKEGEVYYVSVEEKCQIQVIMTKQKVLVTVDDFLRTKFMEEMDPPPTEGREAFAGVRKMIKDAKMMKESALNDFEIRIKDMEDQISSEEQTLSQLQADFDKFAKDGKDECIKDLGKCKELIDTSIDNIETLISILKLEIESNNNDYDPLVEDLKVRATSFHGVWKDLEKELERLNQIYSGDSGKYPKFCASKLIICTEWMRERNAALLDEVKTFMDENCDIFNKSMAELKSRFKAAHEDMVKLNSTLATEELKSACTELSGRIFSFNEKLALLDPFRYELSTASYDRMSSVRSLFIGFRNEKAPALWEEYERFKNKAAVPAS